ncbi:MAG: thioredoxin family protein [Bacteroidota bacterium]|jgi:small redox-active disulfide protein 2|nr:thioredoxin family protein [Ignavibacteria bacterium]HEX2962756.1 thioredoxin family protein [Ignavibacteriales bacterium]MCU7499272.1 thioredoxin family protein [Ignavibacteria bacterium]MCU7512263.1 thioredoxin family protein [Ignavibacteria bacterium]MCU7520289.1 thioredoxin family protein [Ignavibacteria bacterium]
MVVKVLGTGCARCKNLESSVKDVIEKNNIEAEVVKVTDIPEIMKYGILMTPGLVVNEKVVSSGIIPKSEQILQWLKQA